MDCSYVVRESGTMQLKKGAGFIQGGVEAYRGHTQQTHVEVTVAENPRGDLEGMESINIFYLE